jgi:hypothetical protein
MWFLCQKILLTKDNLANRNWQCNKSCCLWDKDEIIQHPSWIIVSMNLRFSTPTSITNLFISWLIGISKNDKVKSKWEVCALLWAIWDAHNDLIFNNGKSHYFFVGYLIAYTLNPSVIVSPPGGAQAIHNRCNCLEIVAQDLYNKCCWLCDNGRSCWCIGTSY